MQADSELQNLLYERRYYESEIALCRGFMSRHSDASVSLQPVEEFWEQADEDLKTKATSRGPSDEKETMEEGGIELPAAELQRKEQHVMMLARLEHEMRLRKRLATDLESLKRKKALVVQRVQEKEKTYKSIMTTIQEVEAASAPLEPYSKPSSSLPSAPLPPPGGHELLDA